MIKIVLIGPECTGKTTLAKQLAEYFQTNWVKEYLREFSKEKLKKENKSVEKSDNYTIVKNQILLEKQAIKQANRFLFCDTNFLQTMIYSELYFGENDIFFDNFAENSTYNLYLLTGIDVPWKPDGLRDAPFERYKHYNYFKKRLMELGKPFVEISGNEAQRKQKAIQVVNDLEEAQKRGFTSEDLAYFKEKGITVSQIFEQMDIFEKGTSYVELKRPATLNDGIFRLSKEEIKTYLQHFKEDRNLFVLQKMVPASGAASRMFPFLIKFRNEFNPKTDTINGYISDNQAYDLLTFLVGLKKFPFYNNAIEIIKNINPDYEMWSKEMFYFTFVNVLLSSNYLNFENLPKAVLRFYHKKETPVRQHLKEAIAYACSNGVAKVHFTVLEEHLPYFKEAQTVRKKELRVSYSFQKKSTDTIAVHLDKTPFRKKDGNILFRQSGHGALLENLNDLQADIVFIKNVDNINPDHFQENGRYKKILAGLLMELQYQTFRFLSTLNRNPASEELYEIIEFAEKRLNIVFLRDFDYLNTSEKIEFLQKKLNRPIRVCGMVKNEGEAGGGPFWVKNKKGEISLQIVEIPQINLDDKKQKQILERSTHFNPVDLVCGIKDYKGDKFNLLDYRDNSTGFLVEKTYQGTPIIGYELPGLWNGAMSDWISVFVEVPRTTFNPIKNVNDFLKPND